MFRSMIFGQAHRRSTGWILLVAVAGWLGSGWVVAAATFPEVVREVRANILADFAPKVPGLSVAVAREGKLIWSEGFGFADWEAKKPVTTHSLFRVGSVAKPMTAAGLMLLVEHGQVELDADIHHYVPDFPDKGQRITTRQLAGHLAGIRHYQGEEFYLNRHFASVQEGLRIFEKDPLLSVPGEKYAYSSYGFNLIGRVMEVAAGKDFLTYMDTAVFKPLAMTNTIPDDATRVIAERTRFYRIGSGGGFELEPAVDNSYKWAAGGFLSTPEDLVIFGSAHLQPGFLTEASLKALFTSQKTRDGKATGYGMGWEITQDRNQHRIWMHTGGAVGGTTILMIRPDIRMVLALTTNCTDAPLSKSHPAAIVDAFSALFQPT